ncbi:MAG TPA: ABC transporter ATP-binding protein [Anaerolineae bacterium]
MLKIENVDANYDFLQVLWDVSLEVNEGEFVALVGPNGAGKTTTLRTAAGLLKPRHGQVVFNGKPLAGMRPHEISRMGLAYVSESLNLFTNMSVRENLLLGAYAVHDKRQREESLQFVFQLFPRLQERATQLAGLMSGGERKMLAIGRGIMSDPKAMLVDEPSLGLAPYLAHEVFRGLQTLNERGVTILLVEQNVHMTLEISRRAYVMEHGRVVMEGPSADLKRDDHVRKAYLGI